MNTFLRRLTIRQRLLGSMLVLCALIILMGVWSTLSLHKTQQQAAELMDTQAATARETSAVLAALERVQRLEQSVMLNGNNANEASDHQALWKKTVAATREQLKAVMADPARAQALQAGVDGFEAHVKPLQDILQQVVDAKMDATAAYAYAGQAQADLDKAREVFNQWALQTNAQLQATREAERNSQTAQAVLRLAMTLAVVALAVGLVFTMVRSILEPLAQASQLAGGIAQGDLCAPIPEQGHDEISIFMRALGEMQQALRAIVGQVRDSADRIRLASDEVATGNLDLSQRTEQTAANLEQTAASMETLTGTLHHSAQAAVQASELAGSASSVAQRGGDLVHQVVQTMAEINQSSRKIADITGVIDGIAFQTNILALNAAVEAARAGEQGRGFAVVASEVRSLATRSAEAAREIKQLIGASVQRVESGSRQVQDAGSTMTELVASVRRVSDIIGDISHSAGAQSQGIGEVGSAVSLLDQMTQQNAALVEESAAAAESLKLQARQLADVVATFRLQP